LSSTLSVWIFSAVHSPSRHQFEISACKFAVRQAARNTLRRHAADRNNRNDIFVTYSMIPHFKGFTRVTGAFFRPKKGAKKYFTHKVPLQAPMREKTFFP
jgi:hypothetical protein